MIRLRPVIALCLALILSLTSVTMAVARGQATGGDSMVICSGYGVVTITLDANGNPVGPVHPCPDCLAGLGLAVLPALPVLPQLVARGLALTVPQTVLPPGRDRPQAMARGPPEAL